MVIGEYLETVFLVVGTVIFIVGIVVAGFWHDVTWLIVGMALVFTAVAIGDINDKYRGTAEKLVDYKTYIPEKGVWISTVAWNAPINLEGNAETMVFRGDEEGITDWCELYYEPHGWTFDRELLRKKHEEIVEKIRSGEIKLGE